MTNFQESNKDDQSVPIEDNNKDDMQGAFLYTKEVMLGFKVRMNFLPDLSRNDLVTLRPLEDVSPAYHQCMIF